MQAKDYAAAEVQLRRALEIDPKDPDTVRLYLGQVNEELKRYDEALKWYASVTQGEQYIAARRPVTPACWRKQGKLADARKYLQEVSAGDAQQRLQLTLAEAGLLRDAQCLPGSLRFARRGAGENAGLAGSALRPCDGRGKSEPHRRPGSESAAGDRDAADACPCLQCPGLHAGRSQPAPRPKRAR